MFTIAAYMYLPSSSGDLPISNTATRDTAKTVISNTTAPAMIRGLSIITEFRFIKIVIQCTFGCLCLLVAYISEDSQIQAQSCRYTRERCNLSVSLKCGFSEVRRGNPPIIIRKYVIGYHLKYAALVKAKFRRIILGKHVT